MERLSGERARHSVCSDEPAARPYRFLHQRLAPASGTEPQARRKACPVGFASGLREQL